EARDREQSIANRPRSRTFHHTVRGDSDALTLFALRNRELHPVTILAGDPDGELVRARDGAARSGVALVALLALLALVALATLLPLSHGVPVLTLVAGSA